MRDGAESRCPSPTQISRPISFRYLRSNPSCGGVGVAFYRYSDTVDPTKLFSRYNSTATYVMSDFEFLSLIKLKILFNTAPLRLKAIKEGLYAIFAGDTVNTDKHTHNTHTQTYSCTHPHTQKQQRKSKGQRKGDNTHQHTNIHTHVNTRTHATKE